MRILLIYTIILTNIMLARSQEMPGYLQYIASGEFSELADGYRAYARGDYAAAYEALRNNPPADSLSAVTNEHLAAQALLFLRDRDRLQQALLEGTLDVPEAYRFYISQPQLQIHLEQHTAVALDKNLFKAVLNDRDTITVMLDTGGSGMGISKQWVDKFQMARDTTIVTSGSLPAFDIDFKKHPVVVPKLQIGAMSMTHIPASYTVYDEENEGKYTGPEFDAIMGLDVFVGFLGEVVFDWEHKELRFYNDARTLTGLPFVFYDSKPFSAVKIRESWYTTVFDTGSTTDILLPEIYAQAYTKKQTKSYGQYMYIEYTVPIQWNDGEKLELRVGDYTDDLGLVLRGLEVPVLIGNGHREMRFNLQQNLVYLK